MNITVQPDWVQGSVKEVAEQLAQNNPEVNEEKAKAAFEKAWEGMYELADMLETSKKMTLMGRPENLSTGAIRLTVKKEPLYGADKSTKEEDVLDYALRSFGGQKQIKKTMEEFAELQKELCKYNGGAEDREHIAEEIADVRIMLDQMAMLFDVERDELEWREQKLERLAGRLGL